MNEGYQPDGRTRLGNPPTSKIVRECDNVGGCVYCGSSLQRKFGVARSSRCINPKCSNYHGKR